MTRPWSERELATLAVVAETFVRGDAVRRARLTTEALDRALDPVQVGQLRLVLRAMESRLANLLLTGRPGRFRTMAPAARERYLLGWGRSRLASRRAAFGSLRKLLTFLAYADPGVDAPNPRLVALGYEPDARPLPDVPTPIVPERLPFEEGPADSPLSLDTDVVIVGSGAGGGVMAASLAAAGRAVVVLEAGPFVDEASMPTNELDGYSRLYLEHGLLATWDGSVTMLAGSAVGGGTLVNWMTCIDAPADVRDEWRREHGLEGLEEGSAWTEDVAAIEGELGVTESAVIPPKDLAILRGAEELGWDAGPTSRDARTCGECGSCAFGCRRGSKQSGIRVHLADAHRTGARIVPGVRVTRVLIERGSVVGVEGEALWPDPGTGEPVPDPAAPRGLRTRRLVVRAPVVVVAAGGLRTPAILGMSGLHHPSLGRHLRIHPVPVVAGRMTSQVDMWRGTLQAARCLEFARGDGHRNGYVIESAPGHPGLLAQALPWEGTRAYADLMADARRLVPLIAITRDGGDGRVSVTKAGRVRADYALDPTGVATMRHALANMARLARAAGARDILATGTPPVWYDGGSGEREFRHFLDRLAAFDFSANRGTVFSAHQMGTARMGASPRDHVCDVDGRVRVRARDDRVVRGLYVADSSLFPTAIGVNPMITVMALSRRVARTVLAEAADRSG